MVRAEGGRLQQGAALGMAVRGVRAQEEEEKLKTMAMVQSCLWIKYILPSAVGLCVHSDRLEIVLCAVAFSVVCCVVHCVGEPSPLSCLVFQCMTVGVA